jgi:transcriptional regulator with XRE-family HTH domain
MKGLKNIREKLGLSQQDMAHWLGISRSLVTLVELGSRSLPSAALIKLSELEIKIADFEKEQGTVEKTTDEAYFTTSPAENIDDTKIHTHPRLVFEQEKANRALRQLTRLKNKHAVLHRQELLIKHIMNNSNGQTSLKEKLWLDMVYHAACFKASKYDEAKQLSLKAKVMFMRVKEEMRKRKV